MLLVHNAKGRCLSDAVREILNIGLKDRINLQTIKNLKGSGKELFETIALKVRNIGTHLTDSDVTEAVRDLLDHPVIIDGRTYNHLGEVKDALSGLGKQIEKLNKGIKNGEFPGDVLKEAERIRSVLSKEKDMIGNILNKF